MTRVDDLWAELEERRTTLYRQLRGVTDVDATRRPTPESWSIVENVRHLLYAEELHLRALFGDRHAWSTIGIPPRGEANRNGAGTESTDDLRAVLRRWDRVHARVWIDEVDEEAAERAVDRNLWHLRGHVRAISRILDVVGEGESASR